MSDLIDRQVAIDCLGFTWPEDAIRNLPSVQPEQRYTEEELRVFQHGISLSLLSKRSAHHQSRTADRQGAENILVSDGKRGNRMTNQEAVKMLRTIKGTVYLGNRKFEDAISYAISALEQPIEPQRMRGRWVEDGYNDEKAVCDQCGEPCATYIMGEPRDKYCKWCGADMRGTE